MKKRPHTFLLIVFSLFCCCINPILAGELNINWENKKMSIIAKDVTVCEVFGEMAKKINIKVRNQNKCDYTINLNFKNKSIDDAVKKILKGDSYTLVDNDSEMELIVLDRNLNQSPDQNNYNTMPDYQSRENYVPPEPYQPIPETPQEMQEQIDNSQNTSDNIARDPVQTDEPIPQESEDSQADPIPEPQIEEEVPQ